jgi:hypothetical protein
MADEMKQAPAAPAAPEHHLVVVHPFGDHARGSTITDPDEIASVLAGENHRHVHRVFPR